MYGVLRKQTSFRRQTLGRAQSRPLRICAALPYSELQLFRAARYVLKRRMQVDSGATNEDGERGRRW
jgi:hypothetical protein